MKQALKFAVVCFGLCASAAPASELGGPGRFCGYSPIIDLLPGERIVTGGGGMHGGSFRWEGRFGLLEVAGIGWASKPPGRLAAERTSKGLFLFKQRLSRGRHKIAIWNGRQGAAYFSAPRPLTNAQLAAINRVALFQEGEEPAGCALRTIFSWQ